MILWKISFREIRSHFWRALLTAASIVIGVAAVVAVNLASVAVRASFGAMQQTIAGDAALQIIPAGDSLFDEGMADQLTDIPGVQATSPVYQRPTVMYVSGAEGEPTRKIKLILLGIDPSRDDLVRDYKLAEGRTLEEGDEVLLDAAFAEGLGLKVNEQVRILTASSIRPVRQTVVGLLKPVTGAAVGRGSVMFMPLATAQRRFDARGQVNQVQIVLEEGADPEQVRAAIAERLPAGLTVRSSASQNQMGEETMRSLQNALRLATWFALVAAIFIVGNAFFMNVTQRQRQTAVMRAIGATRFQIWRLIMREAVLMAVIGTVGGILAGWGGALLLSFAMEQLFRTDLPIPQLTPTVIGLAVAFGLGVSLLGAYLPARRASKVEPVEGMHEISRADVEGVPRWFVTVGTIGFVVFGVLLAVNLMGYLPRYDYVFGAIVFLVCAVPALPLVLEPLTRAASFVMRLFGRPEARIARQQLLRRRVRTTLTIGVLFVASSTGLGLASTVMDNIRDVQQWYRRVMAGDFFLRVLTPDLANWTSPELPEGVEEEVRAIPGIDTVFGVRFVSGEMIYPGQTEPQQIMITARDYPSAESVSADLVDMSPAEIRQRMLAGQVTLGSVLAQRTGLKPGDNITVLTDQGPKDFEIAAIINDYMGGGLVVHMDRAPAEKLLGVRGADAIVVRAQPGQREAVGAAMRKIAEERGLIFQSYTQLTGEIDSMMSGVVGGLWVVMVLGLVVAALGVTNTLSMNVLEQTRELAMLRVVAMTRRQARRTILAQAAILGSIGLLPGVLVGVGLAWLMNRSLLHTIGREVSFGLHPWLGVGGLSVAMILVVVAAWLPAQRAANLEPIQALRYE